MQYLKNKCFSYTLDALRKNENDILFFLNELAPQFKKYPEKYRALMQSLSTTADELKFKPDEKDRYKWMEKLNINTVLDIGAWQGDSARRFHKIFPDATIYSFEPLKDCYNELNKCKAYLPSLTTFNFALGSDNTRSVINRSVFSPSSSLLKMKNVHKEAFPFTADETTEEIEIRTLDSVAPEMDLKRNVLMKIDVQGFEENVLKGAMEVLSKVSVIIIELSFVELYAGQPLFDSVYSLLKSIGFEYAGCWHQGMSPKDGAFLQQDGLFIRKADLNNSKN